VWQAGQQIESGTSRATDSNMTDAPDFIERRHDKRYAITNGIVLPRSTTVSTGAIVNISKGGIAVRPSSSEE